MKVLLINKFYFLKGGSEYHFFDLKKLLEERGHTVSIFAMKHEKNLPSEFEKYFVSRVDFENVQFNIEGLRTAGRMFYSFEASRKLEQLIHEEKPDIAHLHNIYHQISPSILVTLAKHNIPIVLTLHDYKIICPNYLLFTHGQPCERCRGYNYWQCVNNRCIKNSILASSLVCLEMYFHRLFKFYEDKVDTFLCPSQFLTKKIRDWQLPLVDARYFPNFIQIDPAPTYPRQDYLLFFGRLSPEKGLLTLLEAMKKIHYPLKIAGAGPQAEQLKAYVKKENLTQVEFLGKVDRPKLKTIIQNVLAIIQPSECYEVFPTTILEAYANQKPVIGSNHGGVVELIEAGKTGYVFQPGNATDLAEKINKLISQPSQAQKMGERAYNFVKKFNPDSYYQRLMKIYESLVKEKKDNLLV